MVTRLFDIIVSLLGLIFLAPVLIMIAVAVKLDSRGPVFYRGKRTGRDGVPFRIFKFRTMILDADQMGGSSTAARDFRVTRVGHFLRRYKLDELPQLLNVLKGEMSIVGPRPELEEHTSVYTEEERVALTVRPGITDYA
ncbi:MAG TPA: sugar transferase, partial [Pyrinomonadaceae bacterium]|nr:sugar transferase [Pyrinomonadaceae bacterium]